MLSCQERPTSGKGGSSLSSIILLPEKNDGEALIMLVEGRPLARKEAKSHLSDDFAGAEKPCLSFPGKKRKEGKKKGFPLRIRTNFTSLVPRPGKGGGPAWGREKKGELRT